MPRCGRRASSSRSTREPTRRSAGWSRPARPGRRRSATARCARTSSRLTVVTAAGEVVRTRSRARKSSAGYDLTRLFIGSEGTLGVITEVTLRLHPTPEAILAAVCSFGSLSDAVECVVRTLQIGIPGGADRAARRDPARRDQPPAGLRLPVAPTLFLEFHGSDARGARPGRAGRGHRAGARRKRFETATEHDRATPALGRAPSGLRGRARAPAGVARLRHRRLRPDLAARRSASRRRSRSSTASGLLAPLVGHVGDGNFHLAILIDPDSAEELARGAGALRAAWPSGRSRSAAPARASTASATGRSKYLELEHGPEGVRLMRAIKSALDPDGIFNPGKVLPD